MTTRVADFGQSSLNQFQLMQLETQIAKIQTQVGSGQVSQTFDGISAQAQQLVSLQGQSTKITQYLSNNNLASQRTTAAETAITNMMNLATSFQTTLVNALNPGNAGSMALNQTAQNDMQQMAALLNTQFEGQYIFAGSATSTVPVNLSAPGFTAPGPVYPSTPNTSYFQGNSTKLAVQVDDNFSVTYGTTADQTGFEELLRAMHLAATAVTNPADIPRLNEALRVAKLAISDMSAIQAQIGVVQNVLSNTQEAQNQFQLQLKQQIGNISNIDVAQASTDLTGTENTLQASYAVTARLSQLSLVNFLH
jgi:flagellar hook-associated protein 3 FlgL